jgi:two-component sensor histidine kinase
VAIQVDIGLRTHKKTLRHFEGQNESMILTVADNGNGFPSGFEPRKSRSLGMKIIASLCRQLDAELAVLDNQPGVICIAKFSAALHMSR